MNNYADKAAAEIRYAAAQQGQIKGAYALGAADVATGYAQSAPKQQTAFGLFSMRLDQNNESLARTVTRLEMLMDRLAGPTPESAGNASTPAQPHVMAEIEHRLDGQSALLARLNLVAERLSNLA